MSVKRYAMGAVISRETDMYELPQRADGDYVLHSDYAALEADNATLRKLLADEVSRTGGPIPLGMLKQAEQDCDELRSALRGMVDTHCRERDGVITAFRGGEAKAIALLTRLGDLIETPEGLRWRE